MNSYEIAITALILVLAVVTFLAVKWGMTIYNCKKYGVDITKSNKSNKAK